MSSMRNAKVRQAAKMAEIVQALEVTGQVALDDQARALGLARSTTWSILRRGHKSYGLGMPVTTRILANPDLHPRVRAKIIEYVEEKAAGMYGHSVPARRRWARMKLKIIQ